MARGRSEQERSRPTKADGNRTVIRLHHGLDDLGGEVDASSDFHSCADDALCQPFEFDFSLRLAA